MSNSGCGEAELELSVDRLALCEAGCRALPVANDDAPAPAPAQPHAQLQPQLLDLPRALLALILAALLPNDTSAFLAARAAHTVLRDECAAAGFARLADGAVGRTVAA